MQKVEIDWDLMQLYMKILRLKGYFENTKEEYMGFLLKCKKSITECDIMLEEINELSRLKKEQSKE